MVVLIGVSGEAKGSVGVRESVSVNEISFRVRIRVWKRKRVSGIGEERGE